MQGMEIASRLHKSILSLTKGIPIANQLRKSIRQMMKGLKTANWLNKPGQWLTKGLPIPDRLHLWNHVKAGKRWENVESDEEMILISKDEVSLEPVEVDHLC
jgi:hypothetical protein